MSTLNQIGLNPEKTNTLAEKLNVLLADYSLFYQNTRGYHWNIKGDKFFELHVKFEELYNDLHLKVDEIAERILTLGNTPTHSYSDYITMSNVPERKNISNGKEAVNDILGTLKSLIILEREILDLSGDVGDEGTNALMSDYIREQEKLVWMYTAYLG